MKILSSKAHGYVDYITVGILLIAPGLIGFSGLPAVIVYILAAVHLILTVSTSFEPGLIKFIPFPLHGIIEFAVSVLLVVLPWLAGFSEDMNARNFYIVIGIIIFIVFFITNYTSLRKK